MTIHFTVAIPAYNGASRLPSLLDNLLAQATPENFTWQVIVVDNNSTDDTADVIQDYQSRYQGTLSLVYAFEQEQGAAFARQKAMQLAQSELVGFLDDDVVPSVDWVAQAYQFAMHTPKAGAYGGKILGRFEVTPPEGFERIQSFLALRNRGSSPNLYNPKFLSMPPSAAWVVRRQAWLDHVPEKPSLGGRTGKSMVQGDDYEPLLYLHKAGWEIWYTPTMSVEHIIPAKRLEKDYLIALSRGCGLCVCQLRLIAAEGGWDQPATFMKVTAGNLKRLMSHLVEHRFNMWSDTVTQCEFEFFLSSFLSSFYYLLSRSASRD